MRFLSIPFVCLSLVLLGAGCPAPTSPSDNVQPAESVTDFESCAAAGNPVMESYPRQCRAGNTTFTEEFTVPVGSGEPGTSEPGSPGDGGMVTSPPDSGYPYDGSGFELDKTACESAGGTFNECGSACRGAAPNTPCIMMCVMYCECASSSQCPNDMTCGDFVDGTGVCKK